LIITSFDRDIAKALLLIENLLQRLKILSGLRCERQNVTSLEKTFKTIPVLRVLYGTLDQGGTVNLFLETMLIVADPD
jgi:hypothetical protein